MQYKYCLLIKRMPKIQFGVHVSGYIEGWWGGAAGSWCCFTAPGSTVRSWARVNVFEMFCMFSMSSGVSSPLQQNMSVESLLYTRTCCPVMDQVFLGQDKARTADECAKNVMFPLIPTAHTSHWLNSQMPVRKCYMC